MPTGLQIFNDYNTILIDSESTNFAFYAKGTITTLTPPADEYRGFGNEYISYYCGSYAKIALQNMPVNGIFALQCTSNVANLNYASPFMTATAAVIDVGCDGPPGTTVNWWYFAPVSNIGPSTNGAGLRVYRADGGIAYDSGHLPINYVDFISGGGLSEGNASRGPLTYPAGRQYALIISSGGGYYGGKRRTTSLVDRVQVGVGGRVNGNVIYTADVPGIATNTMMGLQGNPFHFAWGVIVVDVTHL